MCINCERRNRQRDEEDEEYDDDYEEYEDESEPVDAFEDELDTIEGLDGEDLADLIGLPSPEDIHDGPTTNMLEELRDAVTSKFKDDLDSDGVSDVVRRWNRNDDWASMAVEALPSSDRELMLIVGDLELWQDAQSTIEPGQLIYTFRRILADRLESLARAIVQRLADSQ